MLQRIGRYFFRGLLVLAPVAVTVWVFWLVFTTVDRWIDLEPWFGRPLPGVGFLITLLIVLGAGFLASNIATRWVFHATDGLFARLPLVKLLYTSIKDLVNAFVGEHKRFDRPVLVDVGGVALIGFATRDDLSELGLDDHVAVYVPQSYNFAGNLLVVPRSRITAVRADSAAVMALIVSGGVAGAPPAAPVRA